MPDEPPSWISVKVLLCVIVLLLVYCLYLNSSLHYERDQMGNQWAQQAVVELVAETNGTMSRWQRQAQDLRNEVSTWRSAVEALRQEAAILQRYRCP